MRQPVTIRPWRSIRAGAVRDAEPTSSPAARSYAESLESPCASCATTPCCTHLPLHTFRVATIGDLNYAEYLLNFDRIRLAITPAGEWSAYYVQACRFLDRSDATCTLHGRPEQPHICVNYNPYSCWYRRVFTSTSGPELLQVDRSRFRRVAELMRFDADGRLIESPSFDELRAHAEPVLDPEGDPDGPEPPIADPAREAWERAVDSGLDHADHADHAGSADAAGPVDAALAVVSATTIRTDDPCDGCAAPCCDTLTFPQGVPLTASSLDYFTFCLGFPGIELLVTEQQWSIVVKSQCRHLSGGRCSVYGRPERPIFCRYYDAMKCTYRVDFGMARAPGSFRVRLGEMAAVLECFDLDAVGAVVAMTPFDDMRVHVERRRRESVAAARAGGVPVPDDAAPGAVARG